MYDDRNGQQDTYPFCAALLSLGNYRGYTPRFATTTQCAIPNQSARLLDVVALPGCFRNVLVNTLLSLAVIGIPRLAAHVHAIRSSEKN